MTPGARDLLDFMRRHGVDVTRENYIDLAYGSDVPDPWTPEHETDEQKFTWAKGPRSEYPGWAE